MSHRLYSRLRGLRKPNLQLQSKFSWKSFYNLIHVTEFPIIHFYTISRIIKMTNLGRLAHNQNAQCLRIAFSAAIPTTVFSNASVILKLFIKTVRVRLAYFFCWWKLTFFKEKCPHGCPCDNYDCGGNESDDENIINGPIDIIENNFITELDYSLNYEVSFEFMVTTVPSNNWHEFFVGKCIEFADNNFKVSFNFIKNYII